MARVLLISYPGYPSSPAFLVTNPWLANAAGALTAAGHEALALDLGTVSMMRRLFPQEVSAQLKPAAAKLMGGGAPPSSEQVHQLMTWSAQIDAHQAAVEGELAEEIAARVRDFRPDLVALEIGDGDGYHGTINLAQRLKQEWPTLHLTAGGRKAAWFRGMLLEENAALDTIIFGDIEEAIVALASVAAAGAAAVDLPGVVYRTPAGTAESERREDDNLDALPLPAYDEALYPAMAGDEKIKLAIISDSRGCSNRCAFCLHPWEDGGKRRLVSAGRLVDTMAALQQRYGFATFRFNGASTPGELMYEVAQDILARGLQVQYNSFGHFRSANPDHFEVLAKSGLYSLFFGLESGQQEILDRAVHKGIKLDRVGETVRAAQAAGIFTAASMIVPLPFDTPETLAESLRFVTELKPDSVPLQFPGLMPGTTWIRHPERYNIEIADVDRFLRDGLDYKIKLLFPPQFWQPLPYKINGQSFHEFTAVTLKFAHDLEGAGLLTNFSHTLAAIARGAGLPPRQLRDLAQLWSVTGDADSMGAMIAQANKTLLK